MLPIRKVLHPTDLSEQSARAFKIACSLAQDYGAALTVLYVAPLETASGSLICAPGPSPYLEQLRSWLQRIEVSELPVRIEHRVRRGHPATEIVRVAEDECSDLIVMGSHGRTGLAHALVGSVAEAVLHKAPCPVITVKAPQAAREKTEDSRHMSVALLC